MSDATKFCALTNIESISRGGTLSFNKIDVSGFHNYITLSGVQKGQTPTAITKAKDYALVYELYWNLKSFVYGGTASDGDSVASSDATRTYKCVNTDGSINSSGSEEPKDRILTASATPKVSSNSIVCGQSNNTNFLRIYNGSTSDEDNFFGYAIHGSGDFGGFIQIFGGSLSAADADIAINGAMQNAPPSDRADLKHVIGYAVLNSKFNVLVIARVSYSSDGHGGTIELTESFDSDPLTVEAERSTGDTADVSVSHFTMNTYS